jgi:hypothetical protein
VTELWRNVSVDVGLTMLTSNDASTQPGFVQAFLAGALLILERSF